MIKAAVNSALFHHALYPNEFAGRDSFLFNSRFGEIQNPFTAA